VPASLFSHELTLMGGLSTFAFDKTDETPPPEISDEDWFITGNAWLSGDFAENISYRCEVGLDTVWRYYLMGEAVFRYYPLKLGIGSFFQYSEEGSEFLNPAMIASAGLEFPGAFFIDARTIVAPYENLLKPGNFAYSYIGFSIGYWTQNLVAGIYFDFKEFEERRTDDLLARDALTRYFAHIGIYDKNRMFTVNIDIGSEVLESEMTGAAADITTVSVLFAAVECIIQMGNTLAWHLKGEIPFAMDYPNSDFFWYKAWTGITVKLAD
jgi:hypothetical protein